MFDNKLELWDENYEMENGEEADINFTRRFKRVQVMKWITKITGGNRVKLNIIQYYTVIQ